MFAIFMESWNQMLSIYIFENVCLFVRSKRKNYGTDWRQTLRNYKELSGECPLRFEISRISVLGEIWLHFRFFSRGRPPFLPIFFHAWLLPRHLTQSALQKRKNYGTNGPKDCKDPPEKCPLRLETAHLKVLGEISWNFRFFRQPFLLISHIRLLLRRLTHKLDTQSAFVKRRRPRATSLLNYKRTCIDKFMYIQACLASSIIICMYALDVIWSTVTLWPWAWPYFSCST